MARGKHFIANVDDAVLRLLRSLLWSDPSLRLIPEKKVLFRQLAKDESPKTILVSGGGSGHEPAHAGYVGKGMLDVAIAGDIFASPSATQILAGIEALEAPLGVVVLVKNYTGDKLNFGLAAEKAKARGRDVRLVIVEDDASIAGNELVGRRGLAGVVFVHKISGAAAVQGRGIDEVARIAQKTADSIITAAASLDRCTVPNRRVEDSLAVDEMEYGMGIHNEPGAQRAKLTTMQNTIGKLVNILFSGNRGIQYTSGRIAVLVNNLGGLSVLETQVLADEIMSSVRQRNPLVVRFFVGTFVTSLDGPGFSITLLKLDDELLPLLDAPTQVNNWPRTFACAGDMELEGRVVAVPEQTHGVLPEDQISRRLPVSSRLLCKVIESIAESVGQAEPQITKYDTIAGDGDCGTTLLSGVNALVQYSTNLGLDSEVDLSIVLRKVASIVEETMGGTSGAIYAIFLNAVSTALEEIPLSDNHDERKEDLLSSSLTHALQRGLAELCKYTSARVGGRTMMDALIPFVEALSSNSDPSTRTTQKTKHGNLEAAVKAADSGAQRTRKMDAVLGRASYVSKDQFALEEDGIPDPGALGIVALLKGVVAGLA